MAERMKLKVTEVGEVKSVGDKGAKKLPFKATNAENKEYWYFSFRTSVFDTIKKDAELDAEVEVTTREYNDNTYVDRKVTQIYVDGQPVGGQKQGGWRGKSPEELDLSRKSYALSYAKDLCVADKIKLNDIIKQAELFDKWMSGGEVAKPAAGKAPAVKDTTTAVKDTTDKTVVKTIGDLFNASMGEYKMKPEDVLKELGYSSKEDIVDPAEDWERIKEIKNAGTQS